MKSAAHIPVLLEEAVKALNLPVGKLIVDATYGRGGHTRAILDKLSPDGQLIVIDRDKAAIDQAKTEWQHDSRVTALHAPFSRLVEIVKEHDRIGKVDAVLFDFGVSSPQLDEANRGFSFSRNGPLDMRMDQTNGMTASSWIKHVDEAELTRVLRVYGEEKFARRIARAIKTASSCGSIETTAELSELIYSVVPTREKNKHPATRTFQAIRIAINDELAEIEQVLPQALEILASGGRMVFISFHSLEDRMIKQFIRKQSRGDPYPRDLPVTSDMLNPLLRQIGKPIKPSALEVARNPRARSAVMRVAEKLSAREQIQ